MAAAAGPPPGSNSAIESMLNAQNQQNQAGARGAHEVWFGKLKVDQGVKLEHMDISKRTMPPGIGVPKPGGGINSKSKPLKKENYKAAPGDAQHVNPQGSQHQPQQTFLDGKFQGHVDSKFPGHLSPQFSGHISNQMRHITLMGFATMQPAFMGNNPYQGMSIAYANGLSARTPFMPNGMPITTIFNAPEMNTAANRAFTAQASMVAAQAAQSARSSQAGRTA